METLCSRLRGLAQDCIDKHLNLSAIFYADKLVTFSNGAPGDVYLLAQAYYAARQYHRALCLLRSAGVLELGAEFVYLAACCLAEAGQWEEVVALLGDDEAAQDPAAYEDLVVEPPGGGSGVRVQAGMALLRGRAFEALDNRGRAAVWYQAALQLDPYCWDAFAALTDGHLLSNEAEVALVEALCGAGASGGAGLGEGEGEGEGGMGGGGSGGGPGRLAEGDRWLALLMRAKCKKYLHPEAVEAALRELEAPPPAAAAAGVGPGDVEGGEGGDAASEPPTPSPGGGGGGGGADDDEMQRAAAPPGGHGHGHAAFALPYMTPPRGMSSSGGGGMGGGDDSGSNTATPGTPPVGVGAGAGAGGQQHGRRGGRSGSARRGARGSQAAAAAAAAATTPTTMQLLHPAPYGEGTPAPAHNSNRHPHQQQQYARGAASTPGTEPGGCSSTPGGGGHDHPPQQQQQHHHHGGDGYSQGGYGHGYSHGHGYGCGLGGNLDVIACRAELLFHRGDYEGAYALTRAVLCGGRDPYALQLLPTHIAAATQLAGAAGGGGCGRLGGGGGGGGLGGGNEPRTDLFLLGHRLTEEHPDLAVSWYAVGCYYLAARQPEAARRHLARATQLQRGFAPAWLAYGHAFSAQDERDQAMSAYRTAARLFPGLHTPHLGLGAEYCAGANLPLAERALLAAYDICPDDPAVCHELGVLMYKCGQAGAAAMWLDRALQLLPGGGAGAAAGVGAGGRPSVYWEPTLVALGHCLRKLGRYAAAADAYRQALALAPASPGTLAALGYTAQLAGEPRLAVDHYHAALALRPDDPFTADMLRLALQEYAEQASAEEEEAAAAAAAAAAATAAGAGAAAGVGVHA
ncbi:hypothetical protein HXX76_014844 [Chlamydomonas incerta]|uniref:Uncharacterized protein n=1 Tax=Chlamydomonas incerta TaxID=51695 RepID=A0A835VSM5_CHLIN|nr:hypothetical protein HXX76_014844 [Chlamydomonas incerta]|eukprot:KAG2424019.1 hypothetical protein HXX76_014844 [Chlamydomonas incerta]